jgi:membrane protease YdiL (CAAX protease family)
MEKSPKKAGYNSNRNLILFFVITLAWTWIVGFIPLFVGTFEGVVDVGIGYIAANDALFKILAGPAPSIVALVLVLRTFSKEQKRDYFKRTFSFRQMGIKWPLLIMGFYAIVTAATVLVNTLLNGNMPEFSGIIQLSAQPYMIFLFLFFAIISGPLNEEFGWRGYSLDRLFTRFGFWKSSAILGFIWCIWHLPWYFYPGNGQYIAWQAHPFHGLVALTIYHITFACIISIVYIKTKRSIMSAFFVHMIGNFFTGSLLIYPFDTQYFITMLYVRIVLEGLIILYFVRNSKFKNEIKQQIENFKEMEVK